MAGGEEERRRLVEQAAEPAAGRVVPEKGLDLPVRLAAPHRVRHRLCQVGVHRSGHRVARIGGGEEAGPRAPAAAAGLSRDHALGVTPIFVKRIEEQAADGVLHVELVLEGEGDRLRISNQ